MPSLNDFLSKNRIKSGSDLKRDISSNIKASIKATSDGIKSQPGRAVQDAQNKARSGIITAANNGLAAVKDAAAKAMKGDFSGGLEALSRGPAETLGSLRKTFGLDTGSKLTRGGTGVANSLQGALSRADPMLSFNWYCELPDVTPIGGAPVSLPWNYVEEATPPFRTFDVRAIYSQGRNKHYAGVYSVDNLRLALYADVDNKSMNYINAWQGAILAPFSSKEKTLGGGFGRPSGYKKPITIYLIDQAKRELVTMEFIECWPPQVDALTLDSGSSNRLVFNVNFSVGDVFITTFAIDSAKFNGLASLDFLSPLTTA